MIHLQADNLNIRLEAEVLYTYNFERYDLMCKAKRFESNEFGKGLFARKFIPRKTVLAYYPGDRISQAECEERSKSRMETDRFVFQWGKIL